MLIILFKICHKLLNVTAGQHTTDCFTDVLFIEEGTDNVF